MEEKQIAKRPIWRGKRPTCEGMKPGGGSSSKVTIAGKEAKGL